MRNLKAFPVAFGGVSAALAVVVMCLGGLVPVATYICPVLCCLLGNVVLRFCGNRIAWTWYPAVALLAVLLSPDKEAAAVFACFGFYPMVKLKMDKLPLSWLWKLLLFNLLAILLYAVVLRLLGMDSVTQEFQGIGLFGSILILLLGNATFFLLDKLLGKRFIKR